ncbi:hypothetical protein BYI23_C000140 [Burkholderia sp. YI23]|nr:hypothetical protein BYI23_C000140 [Burkholderia sp. YI23]
MPVVLPPRPETPPPSPPHAVVWLLICAVIMATAVLYTLFAWPVSTPTGTAWFWTRLVGFPALACVILYGLRLLYFEREAERAQAEKDQWMEDCEEATRFAQEPLALLASSYLCSLGDRDVVDFILAGGKKLESQTPVGGVETIRHTALSLIDDALLADRYASCYRELLAAIDDSLRVLPGSVPFEVYLHGGVNLEASELRGVWQACWAEAGYRAVEAIVLEREGVMALDAWLDTYGGAALEKFALFVAVQLHEVPPADSAEAAVALLLGWTPLAERNGSPIRALVHRPVESLSGNLDAALSMALLSGRADPKTVADVWQTGLAPADKFAMLDISSEIGLGASKTDELSGFHDMDLVIGHAGVADAWLAIALAAECARQTGKAQAVATRQHHLRFAVIQPAEDHDLEPA